MLVNNEIGMGMLQLGAKCHFPLLTQLEGLDNQRLWLSIFYKQLCHTDLFLEFL